MALPQRTAPRRCCLRPVNDLSLFHRALFLLLIHTFLYLSSLILSHLSSPLSSISLTHVLWGGRLSAGRLTDRQLSRQRCRRRAAPRASAARGPRRAARERGSRRHAHRARHRGTRGPVVVVVAAAAAARARREGCLVGRPRRARLAPHGAAGRIYRPLPPAAVCPVPGRHARPATRGGR